MSLGIMLDNQQMLLFKWFLSYFTCYMYWLTSFIFLKAFTYKAYLLHQNRHWSNMATSMPSMYTIMTHKIDILLLCESIAPYFQRNLSQKIFAICIWYKQTRPMNVSNYIYNLTTEKSFAKSQRLQNRDTTAETKQWKFYFIELVTTSKSEP